MEPSNKKNKEGVDGAALFAEAIRRKGGMWLYCWKPSGYSMASSLKLSKASHAQEGGCGHGSTAETIFGGVGFNALLSLRSTVTSVRADIQWMADFYENFADNCAIANDCRGTVRSSLR